MTADLPRGAVWLCTTSLRTSRERAELPERGRDAILVEETSIRREGERIVEARAFQIKK